MKISDIQIGAEVFGRVVAAMHSDVVELRCECGNVTPVKMRHMSGYTERNAARRCRACGYANAKAHHRETRGGVDRMRRRAEICQLIVAEIGTIPNSRAIETDPVVVGLLDWFEREDLGGMPFTSAEIGTLMGITRAAVCAIEARASHALRHQLTSKFDVVEELRERDADRDWFPMTRVA